MARKKSASKGKAKSKSSGSTRQNSPLDFIQNLMSEIPDDVRQTLLARLVGASADEGFLSPPPGSNSTQDKVERLINLARSQLTVREALPYAEQAVAVARQAIGKRFDKLVGRFGSDPKGLIYLDALVELLQTVHASGDRAGALAQAEEVLRLDPSDPLDIRQLLLEGYFDVGQNDDARRLLAEHCPEPWAVWHFGRLLVSLRGGERGELAERQLQTAHAQNRYLLSLLLGERLPDLDPPEFLEPGTDSEAQEYAQNSLTIWRETPGAISWLREAAARLELEIDPFPPGPKRRLTARDFARLPPHEVSAWVVGIHELSRRTSPSTGTPDRRWLLFALDPESVFIETDVVEHPPKAKDLWNFLVDLMFEGPSSGRPQKLQLIEDTLLRQLQKDAARAGIELAPYEFGEDLIQHLDGLLMRMEGSAAALQNLSPDAIRQAPLHPDEVWEAAVARLPQRVQIAGQSLSISVAMVMNRAQATVLAHEIFTQPPPPEALENAVRVAIASPMIGDPRRPRQIVVRDADEALSLRALSEEAEIPCEIEPELALIDAALADMAEKILGPPPAVVLCQIEGITPDDLERFYSAAAEFYRAQPWKRFDQDDVVGFDWPASRPARRFGVVMGQSGLTLGLAIYDRLNDLAQMFEYDAEQDSADGFSVVFGEEGDIPIADIDALVQFGWPVATPEAYPLALRVRPGKTVQPPTADELRSLTASLAGVVQLTQNPTQKSADMNIPNGPTAVTISRLGWIGDLAPAR